MPITYKTNGNLKIFFPLIHYMSLYTLAKNEQQPDRVKN